MTTFIICYTPTKIISEKITINILKLKLASCVSISKNIKSMYTYKKKICKENEYKLTIKTKKKLIEKVVVYLKTTHPYKKINITIV